MGGRDATQPAMSSQGVMARSRLGVPRIKAISRVRVNDILDQIWNHHVTVLLAPAGSGKTTALADFAGRSARPVAWITCSGIDDSSDGFVAHLDAAMRDALREALPDLEETSAGIDATLAALQRLPDGAAIVVDDVHTLAGTPAEAALGQFVTGAPDSLRIVLGSRRELDVDLNSIRLMGQLLVVGPEELRFRSWEAEQLFRDLYETWLRPDDIARLSRRVDGWAAGLQMFHLAARGLSPPDQRLLIDRLNGRARIVREYLAANVMEPLSSELRSFLIDTCVVGVITPAFADELRGQIGSEHHLRELASRQMFTMAVDDEDTYRYHEVLRTQLESLLLERDGEDLTALRYRTAGALLEARGLHHDALRCFARAGDWGSVRRLANPSVEQLQSPNMAWISDVPASIVADDPWLLLARARASRVAGRWTVANESITAAESKGVGADFADRCRRERAQIAAWLDQLTPVTDEWIRIARAGCRRDPLGAAALLESGTTPESWVVAATLRIIGGDARGAERAAARAISADELGPFGIGAALTVTAIIRLLVGAPGAERSLDEAETYAERAGCGWVARIARSSLALTNRPGGVDEADRVHEQCVADGDPWGAAISSLLGGLGATRQGQPAAGLLERADAGFAALDAGAARSFCAVVTTIQTHTEDDLASATGRPSTSLAMADIVSTFVRQPGRPAEVVDDHALSTADGDDSARVVHDAVSGAAPQTAVPPAAAETRQLSVRCFGQFELFVHGARVNLDGLRPRARALLKLLALQTDRGVHRETIIDALWPECETEAGIHNVQVAASSVRKVLAGAGVDDRFGIQRQGEAYRLVLPESGACDVVAFRDRAQQAKAAQSRGDDDGALHAARRALAIYRGELLVEDGPLDWIVAQRSWASALREAMTAIVAAGHLRRGDFRDAIDACEATIIERPYADELWRLLVIAHRERGDAAAAGRAQSRYEHVLAEIAG